MSLFMVFGSSSNAFDTPKVTERAPWTSSHFSGTPDPPPLYVVEPAFPKLTFVQPVVLVSAPGTDRLFVGEQRGRIYSFPNDPQCDQPDLVIDLAVSRPELTQFYGLTFHPRFAENRYVYLCYVLKDGDPNGTRVSRFEVTRTDPPRIAPESEKILITWLGGGHNGGCLAFGRDGFLYISTGDATPPEPPDRLHTGQDVSDLLSSILRIDVDREDPGKPYRVPPDNPFVSLPGARPEIWAFGFRNPWKMSFDRLTGDLWVGDVGWELWELVDRVERGGNYGWSVVEGRQPVNVEDRRGPGPILPPTVQHPHSEAASVTGGYVYRGTRLKELIGAYIYGDFQTGRMWGLRLDGKQVVWHKELANTPLQLVAFGEDNAGELYAVDYDRTKQIYRLVPNPLAGSQGDFPRRLSRTGLFTSTKGHVPAPGVISYSINAELWSDHAQAERFVALPGRSQIDWDPSGNWKLPNGSVLVRTVSMELERGNPKSLRRLETQVLHREDETWRPYTYLWNDDQTDATLADSQGATRTLTVRDDRAPGGQRVQTYRFHSRAECQLCHNPWAGKQGVLYGVQSASPLGFSTAQLNRDQDGNPLDRFEKLGMFAHPLPKKTSDLPRQANPYDPSLEPDHRARSYFQVNCAHCHQSGAGGSANIILSDSVELKQTKTVGVRPIQGTFGIDNARIIAPGDPDGSVLVYRMAKLGGGRMPRVGSNLVDERGLELVTQWIADMKIADDARAFADPRLRVGAKESEALTMLADDQGSPQFRAHAIRALLESTRGALTLVRMIDASRVKGLARREAIAAGKDHPKAEVRDLFERFVPDAERVKRLGDVVNAVDLLALKGDAERGKRLFFADSAMQCKTCHRINGSGETLGPDLSKIGEKYAKPVLLQEILEPSRTIEPKYVAYLLETKAGLVHSGLLVEKNEREVILKDARNQTIRVPASDVEQLVSQPKSLMPELLLREMTAQQAADLLEYLVTLK